MMRFTLLYVNLNESINFILVVVEWLCINGSFLVIVFIARG